MTTDDDEARAPVVVVEAAELPADDIRRARALGKSVVILPRRRADDGRGVYGEATVFLAKDLRAEGVDVAYLDASEDRLFEVKKSALGDAFITIVLGIVGNAGWAGIRALIKREHDGTKPLEVTYTDLAPDGSAKSWTVRGPGSEVVEVIDRLRSETPHDGQ